MVDDDGTRRIDDATNQPMRGAGDRGMGEGAAVE